MKIALDPYMFRDVPLLELPALVAELGYEWIELSPRDDVNPFFLHPRIDDATVRRFRRELSAAGVGISSVLPLYKCPHRTKTSGRPPSATGNAPSRSPPTSASTP